MECEMECILCIGSTKYRAHRKNRFFPPIVICCTVLSPPPAIKTDAPPPPRTLKNQATPV